MKILKGHISKETAYLVEDYPYGFRLRCKIRYWLEHNPKLGTRMWSQTSNPKIRTVATDTIWNKAKASTYAFIAGCMFLNEEDHVTWSGLTQYSDAYESEAWLEKFKEGIPKEVIRRVEDWIEEKRIYEAGGRDAWLKLKLQRLGVIHFGKEKEDTDAHRRNPDFCAKCGGQCYFDDEGKRIIKNQGGDEI